MVNLANGMKFVNEVKKFKEVSFIIFVCLKRVINIFHFADH